MLKNSCEGLACKMLQHDFFSLLDVDFLYRLLLHLVKRV